MTATATGAVIIHGLRPWAEKYEAKIRQMIDSPNAGKIVTLHEMGRSTGT